MISACILSGIVGLLLGLLYCYWKEIKTVYENKDLISSGSTLLDAAQDFYDKAREKV